MNNGRYITETEEFRANICSEITQKKISQSKAAIELGISPRQVKRLYAAFLKEGIAGLASKKRGKASNHQLLPLIKARIMELVTCEKYQGFRPTFMCEKLEQLHGIRASEETTRQLMR